MTAYPQFDVILKALNLSSVGVIITDPEQKDNPIIFVNTGFENITGYAKRRSTWLQLSLFTRRRY